MIQWPRCLITLASTKIQTSLWKNKNLMQFQQQINWLPVLYRFYEYNYFLIHIHESLELLLMVDFTAAKAKQINGPSSRPKRKSCGGMISTRDGPQLYPVGKAGWALHSYFLFFWFTALHSFINICLQIYWPLRLSQFFFSEHTKFFFFLNNQ